MKILILNGSARRGGNTSALVEAFREGAESAGHVVEIANVGCMKINGCLGCEYCHGKGEGKCIQADDMQGLYPKLSSAEMVVIASPVHYWSFSGQLQSCITRWYAPGQPSAKKYALILSSGSEGVYDAIISQYKSILEYFGAEDCGIKTFAGEDQKNATNLDAMRAFGKSMRNA